MKKPSLSSRKPKIINEHQRTFHREKKKKIFKFNFKKHYIDLLCNWKGVSAKKKREVWVAIDAGVNLISTTSSCNYW